MTGTPARAHRASRRPTAVVLVALAATVLAMVVGAAGPVDAHASNLTGKVAGTHVRASDLVQQAVVGAGQDVLPGQSRETSPSGSGAAIGSRVAPQTAGAGIRQPGPGTPHIDDFAPEAIPGRPFTGRNAPQKAFDHLGEHHGLDPRVASNRLHVLKQQGGLGAADDVVIGKTGDVYNAQTGERLGTLTDPNLGRTR